MIVMQKQLDFWVEDTDTKMHTLTHINNTKFASSTVIYRIAMLLNAK